jgi:NhaP-type Na+/H+ or K+/H+ antiporter
LELYLLLFVATGLAILIVSWMPLLLRELPLSLPMLAVAIGAAVAWLLGAESYAFSHRSLGERLTEIVLIISVMGAGLKIDRRFAFEAWKSTWRLLVLVMPLSILGIALLGWGLLDLSLGAAILLGGILAPTDPVLASEVQVGPPGRGEEGELRFALTSEAGLNDGAAFPFVTLGLLILGADGSSWSWIGGWLLIDVIWKICAGAALGVVLGWLLVRLNQRIPECYRLSRTHDGLVAVGLTFLAYGLAEIAHAYGFIAVFATAVTIRNTGRAIGYAQELHEFGDQIERLASFFVLVLFGGALAGGLLGSLPWVGVLFSILVLFVVRPIASLIGFIGSSEAWPTRLAIGYFGIRGLASFYYAIYAGNRVELEAPGLLGAVVGFTVLLSIVVYGSSAHSVMRRLDVPRDPGGKKAESDAGGRPAAESLGGTS